MPLGQRQGDGERADISESAMKYVNRLSDYFFVLGRWACVMDGEAEQFYTRSAADGLRYLRGSALT